MRAQPIRRAFASRHLEFPDDYAGKVVYPTGVRWACVKCGACCMDQNGRERKIWMLKREAETISKLTGLEVDDFSDQVSGSNPYTRVMKKKDGACFFLRDLRCSVYSERPLTCRFYPFSLTKEDKVAVFKLTDEPCPGLGFGKPLRRGFFLNLLGVASKRLLNLR
ncbi:MAG: YkgJ family cysteine cluster protein [Candidatus Bathyarchaeia archaeon]